MNPNPHISIVLPVFKEDEVLPKTLTSLANQTIFPECEIILAHYQSSDLLDMLFSDVPVGVARRCRVVNVKKKGIGYARDKGIRMSKGKYLVNMDADSFVLKPTDLQKLLAPILSTQAKMTQPFVHFNDENITYDQMLLDVQNELKRYIPYNVSEIGMCFSKSDYLVAGGFEDVLNFEGARLALNFVRKFGWNSIQVVEDVTFAHERRRPFADLDHQRAYRSGKLINIR